MRNDLGRNSLYILIENGKYLFTGTAEEVAAKKDTNRQYIYNLSGKPTKQRQILKIGKKEPVIAVYTRKDTLEGVYTLDEYPHTHSYLYRLIKRGKHGDINKKTAYIVDYDYVYFTTPLVEEEEK